MGSTTIKATWRHFALWAGEEEIWQNTFSAGSFLLTWWGWARLSLLRVNNIYIFFNSRSTQALCTCLSTDKSCSLYLFAHLIERLRATAGVAELHLHGVVEQRQAAARLQDPVGFLQEERPVEPVEGRHGRHQVGRAVVQGQLLGRTLSWSQGRKIKRFFMW